MLSLENRENKDLRSVNAGFHALCEELEDISFSYAFELIISTFKQCFSEYLHLADDKINAAIDYFLSLLPSYFKDKLRLSMCES